MAIIDASSGTIHAFVIDHRLRAYRADGQSMTETDWSHVYEHFQSLPEPPAAAVPIPVTPNIFGATTKPEPSFCEHCRPSIETPEWRRNGKIIWRTWPDGRPGEWACHYCGRAA